eukprot:scaffold86995_cov18-Tisochrysis_lutea.AAC.3
MMTDQDRGWVDPLSAFDDRRPECLAGDPTGLGALHITAPPELERQSDPGGAAQGGWARTGIRGFH